MHVFFNHVLRNAHLECEVCRVIFENCEQLSAHFRDRHLSYEYRCDFCGTKFLCAAAAHEHTFEHID